MDDLREMVHSWENKWKMLTIQDVVWNHAAKNSPWLQVSFSIPFYTYFLYLSISIYHSTLPLHRNIPRVPITVSIVHIFDPPMFSIVSIIISVSKSLKESGHREVFHQRSPSTVTFKYHFLLVPLWIFIRIGITRYFDQRNFASIAISRLLPSTDRAIGAGIS